MVAIEHHSHSNAIDCGTGPGRLCFTPDPKDGPERLWFDCQASTADERPGSQLCIEIAHADGILGFDPDGEIRPAVLMDDADWSRLPPGEKHQRDDGCCLVRWCLPMPRSHIRVATCAAYPSREVDQLVADSAWIQDRIGVSRLGRFLRRIRNRPGDPASQRPGVYILARQHAGETPASWVLDGLVRACAEPHDDDPVIWAIPLADIDGVATGRYGKNRWPEDHNRNWYDGGQVHEVSTYRADAERWARRCRPLLALDLHAPDWVDPDCYAYHRPCSAEQDRLGERFFGHCRRLFGERAREPFVQPNEAMIELSERLGMAALPSAQDWFMQRWPGVLAATLEFSYQTLGGRPASPADYRALGADLAAAIRTFAQECR